MMSFLHTARVAVLVAGVLSLAGPALAQRGALGGAESFGVLGGAGVASSGASAVTGDVGAGLGGTVTGFPPGTIAPGGTIHEADAVAVQALRDAEAAYDELAALTCPAGNDLTGQNLGGLMLAPGVYCFGADAPLTGTLTLSGAGPWIFQVGGMLTVSPGAAVVAPAVSTACKGSGVHWQVEGASATLGAGANVLGNILSRVDVGLGAGTVLDGRAVALDGEVAMNAAAVAACSFGDTFPPHPPFKVTGGGQVSVPDPDVADFHRPGRGRGTFGFIARPGRAGYDAHGRFLYLNHTNRSHVFGLVRDLDVVAVNDDGSPKTVRFDGVCRRRPACTFSVLVEDNGEPGRDDRFGLVVVSGGQVVEARSLRQIARGNIQFHVRPRTSLSTDVNDVEFGPGSVMEVAASMEPSTTGAPVDAYLVLRLPDGQLMSWTGAGLAPGLVPIARNFVPFAFEGIAAQIRIPAGAPPGDYAWLSGLTAAGTLNLVTPISETVFTIVP